MKESIHTQHHAWPVYIIEILTFSVTRSIWNRICRPRHSMDLWPDSSQHRPHRTHHSDGEPDGSHPRPSQRTVVAIEKTEIKISE